MAHPIFIAMGVIPPSFSPILLTSQVYTLVICNYQSLISQVSKVVPSLGEKLDFFSPLGFDI